MKMAGLLVFLLFPALTFAQETPPTKPITWEKEGLKAYHYIRNKYPKATEFTQGDFEEGEQGENFCTLIYIYITDKSFKSLVDKETSTELAYSLDVLAAELSTVGLKSAPKKKLAKFVAKCINYNLKTLPADE